MRAEIATLDWPDEDLFDSEEQDEPLAGQDHADTIDSLCYPLRGRLSGPDCYVAAELRVHRDPHHLRDYREPYILVALGVADWVRSRYDLWTEPKAPDLVIEVLSPSSVENKGLTGKRDWYRNEGVREYVVLDPSGAFAPEPRLQAWHLGDRPVQRDLLQEYRITASKQLGRGRGRRWAPFTKMMSSACRPGVSPRLTRSMCSRRPCSASSASGDRPHAPFA